MVIFLGFEHTTIMEILMKNTFATLALFAISSAASLSATTEAAKADTAACPAAAQCTASNCNKAVAATTPAPSASTMTAAQQEFCNKLNSKAQQMFKAMDSDARTMAMEMAKMKEPNQAVEESATKMAPKA